MTIKEFANAIGVSATTVSRVMHGGGRISPDTRRMVLKRMEELDFTPNINAQRLNLGRTSLIALDFGRWSGYLSDMFFSELTGGVQEALQTRGYGVLLSGPGEALQRWVKTRAVDGVILMGLPMQPTDPEQIARTGTPCVMIGHHAIEGIAGIGSVTIGLEKGVEQVAQALADGRHRQIGFISSEVLDDVYLRFREALERHGIPSQDLCLTRTNNTPKHGAAALQELLARNPRITAVFARTDILAVGALQAAHRLGLRVPDVLSIIGHDDVPLAELTEPPLTTVRVDCVALARLATDMLLSLLNAPHIQPQPRTVPTRLIMRETVAALNPAAADS